MKPMIFHYFTNDSTYALKISGYKRRGITLVVTKVTNKYVTIGVSECSIKDTFCRKTGVAQAYKNGLNCVPTKDILLFIDSIGYSSMSWRTMAAIKVLAQPRGK